MKKLLGLVLLVAMLMTNFAFAENANKKFDLDVFTSQKRVEDPKYNQYSVSLDDMEARGFISLNKTIFPDSTGYAYDHIGAGMWLYVCKPDIYLYQYGTKQFVPFPRIWFEYDGKELYTYDTAIFKIGGTTYTFDNIYVSYDTSNWNYDTKWSSKSVCICDREYIDFMEAWIANGTASIKIRLKGNRNTRDFACPQKVQKDILLMFQNFKDAGGYAYLPTLN